LKTQEPQRHTKISTPSPQFLSTRVGDAVCAPPKKTSLPKNHSVHTTSGLLPSYSLPPRRARHSAYSPYPGPFTEIHLLFNFTQERADPDSIPSIVQGRAEHRLYSLSKKSVRSIPLLGSSGVSSPPPVVFAFSYPLYFEV